MYTLTANSSLICPFLYTYIDVHLKLCKLAKSDICTYYDGRSNEMLLHWQYCDQDKECNIPVIASKYYKTMRNLEDCKLMTNCNGTSWY